jgi:flagellar assembly protein FliH
MSTSPKLAPDKFSPARAPSRERPPFRELEPFPYPAVPAGLSGLALQPDQTQAASAAAAAGQAARELEARTQGCQEGQREARKAFDEQLTQERASLAAALSAFTRDRAAYFEKVEAEIVQLALSIARRILHREAQVDPLLLAGIVRVALEQIDSATGVALRVNPQNAADWRRYLGLHLDPSDLPEILEDPAQPVDRCTLETSMGTAVIGLEVQLKEIEQGLMDLLSARPGAAS